MAGAGDALGERVQSAHETDSLLYNRIMDNVECGRGRLNDIVEQEVRQEEEETREKEEEQTEVNIDLIGRENEKVLKVAYRGF